ncbi:arsenic resistance protein [Vibrio sonorensis]|uniref:arsenic resistance protein n=1 Tax=Vibrio sonorensis TaxID=1004316 RepID=UPI0008DAE1E2|nr:hypothetical protein [Vibrio sonorensis]
MKNLDFSHLSKISNHSTLIILVAIVIGSTLGFTQPQIGEVAGELVDPTILVLVFLLLFEVPIKGIFKGFTNLKFLSIAWVTNFVVIPLIGVAVASLFLSGQALFYTGLVIYFMAPCTDWYLGFIRVAKGNVELGAALLPVNMITQLILFPVYLLMFDTFVSYKIDLMMLIDWFIQPLAAAVVLRIVTRRFMSTLLELSRIAIPLTLGFLVANIFAANIGVLASHLSILPLLFGAIFAFFIITLVLSELVSKAFNLPYGDHCVLSFTTAARNAPLMLGLTTVAIPDQPLIYATITIGMLFEFPHLTAIKAILLKRLSGTTQQSLANS